MSGSEAAVVKPAAPEGMALIPAGVFLMGSECLADERPVHEVYLDAYYIDIHPVTNRQYKEFCDTHQIKYPQDPGFSDLPNYFLDFPDYPVVMVRWIEANIYALKNGKRLPSEAEWEKAARGGLTGKLWPWGDEFDSRFANSQETGLGHPTTIATYPANGFGLQDMVGNVLEWCDEWFDGNYYRISPRENPKGVDNASYRSLRGGSWYSNAQSLRCAFRNRNYPRFYGNYIGFRCVQVV